jgi:UDP-glucose 4-epimerase
VFKTDDLQGAERMEGFTGELKARGITVPGERLLCFGTEERLTLFDNFSSGQEWHYAEHAHDPRLQVVRGDAKDLGAVEAAIGGHDLVIHLASNPDIAAAMTDPTIDFWQGTHLTQNVVEAMRRAGVKRLLYASGSGIYGDVGHAESHEDQGPIIPVSTYGASKLHADVVADSDYK